MKRPGETYDELLQELAEEYYSPRVIAELKRRVADIRAGNDEPRCGSPSKVGRLTPFTIDFGAPAIRDGIRLPACSGGGYVGHSISSRPPPIVPTPSCRSRRPRSSGVFGGSALPPT